jgi:hypothetical protein
MFEVVKNQSTGKYELKIKAGADAHFSGTHTAGFTRLSTAIGTSGQNISDPKNIIMGHETLGHALENMTSGDTSQHRAIEIENQLRQEQHLPERAQDPPPPE